MGAFICQISEIDWLVSRKIGVYGNREGSERNGKVVYFNKTRKGEQIIQSIIEDLIGMRKGDIVFFHVLKEKGESSIHGIYRAREEPFYNDNLRIWKSSSRLIYPYRFCFEPHPDYNELCKYDANMPVSEFYRSVENRNILSVLTLEREVRGAAHAVKKIAHDDAKEIIKLLYRHFHISHLPEIIEFKPMQMHMTPLRSYIQRIGEIEFAIKSLVVYELGRKNSRITKHIPACRRKDFDFIIETFVGQTMRRPTDIMCIADENSKLVTTIEAKTDQADMNDLIQSIQYQEIFKLRNIDKGSLNYKFSICLLARRFHPELIEYASVRNIVLPWEEVILLKYDATQNGKDAIFIPQKPPAELPSLFVNYPELKVREPLKQTSSKVTNFYKIFNRDPLRNITLELKSAKEDLVILNKKYKDKRTEVSIGHIFIYQVREKCSLGNFTEFMRIVYDEANNFFKGDFMSVEPIIIAEEYHNSINLFINTYNKFETLAQHAPITAYIKS